MPSPASAWRRPGLWWWCVGDGLYFCTPHRQVIALDPETGQERWRFDPEADTAANEYLACRGVAYYEAPAGTPCRQRIVCSAGSISAGCAMTGGSPCRPWVATFPIPPSTAWWTGRGRRSTPPVRC
ncbi:PQQ-binding-like beta-propeller repeat protein [Tistrella mobilis]|uniref:PQQ-binding-like beta-propeller repeat protein n=1 Tax=Tistrella mobilis TaxID=171437 RepID=UPI0009DB42FD